MSPVQTVGARAEASPSPFEGLGPALQALREAAGLRPSEVSERSGVSASVISRYEAGKSRPKVATLDAILEALGVDVLDLGLQLYRQQAKAKRRARTAVERPDLLATPAGRQILEHARMLFHMGSFWTEAALAVLPAARAVGRASEDGEAEDRRGGAPERGAVDAESR